MKITTQVLPKFSEIVTLDDDLSYKFVSLYENLKSRPKGLFRRMKSKFAWLIRENASLHEFIETLGEYEDSLNLYDFYAAYNIKFPAETVSWVSHDGTQITDIGDMAELLSAILYDAGKDYYRAVILSPDLVRYRVHHKDLEELRVKIIQQFIYLRICIPVVILGSPETRTKRNVRLSIFGTKKSGKSTIINAMLGDEYSLSSSELPTPCRIIYAEDKIANRNIILEQDGMRKIFPSPEELKNFLSEKFRYAAKHSGSIDNFYVTIPAFPEIFRALTIVDTPGPNFAGAASHHDIAYSEIDYADICLFVMNYSSHLTEDEIELFDSVYNKRKHTVIIALNRIDEMYSSEVVKSYERAADYIASRLHALGYDDFLVVPVSALTSIYAQKIDLPEEGRKKIKLIQHIENLRQKYRGSEKSTLISFVKNIMQTKKDFHGQEIKSLASLEDTGRIKYLQNIIMNETEK